MMRKLFSIFTFVLLYVTIAFGQAEVDISLIATEATTQAMSVGLDVTATNCIDIALGEAEAPPPPPPGGFHIVFDLDPYGCPAITTWKDYRNAPLFPYSGQKEHTLTWQRSATGTAISIQYDLPNGAAMTIKDQVGGIILNLGPFTGAGTTTIPGSYPFSSALLIMDYDVVPVELTSFTAAVSGGNVLLNWTTATELNNQGFDIERQAEGNWSKIGYVPGYGTTTEPRSYSFMDESVATGIYIYRLKQIDFDGTFSYSNEIVVEVDLAPNDFALSQNYPNPFNPTTAIQFQVPKTSDIALKIYDMLGQEIKTLFAGQVEPGKYTVNWDGLNDAGAKMSSGSYIYRMIAGEFIQSKEMVLLK
jgi:hypothetical protein